MMMDHWHQIFRRSENYMKSDIELRELTDEEMKYTIPCWCDRCGTELRIHPMFPLVGGLSLNHACVAKPQILFEIREQKLEPMQLPMSLLFCMDYRYDEDYPEPRIARGE